MTVASSISKTSFIGSNSAGPFLFGFKFYQNEDITVVKTDLLGVVSYFAEGTDYTLSGAGLETGGTINLSAILPTGEELTVSRVIDILQNTSLINQGAFYPELHETALDKLTMMIQQVNTDVIEVTASEAITRAIAEAIVPENVVSSQLYASSIVVVPGNYATLEAARVATGAVGKTVVVLSALTQAQSNITAAWPADRALKIEKGGSIANTTAFTFADGASFSAGDYQVFTGAGALTGLKEARPEWFGAVGDGTTQTNVSGFTIDTYGLNKALASLSSGGTLNCGHNKTYVVGVNVSGTPVGIQATGLSNITINGNGSTLIPPTSWTGAGGTTITLTTCTNIRFTNFNLNRKQSVIGIAKAMQGISLVTCSAISFEGCEFKDCYHGILFSNTSYLRVNGCRFIGIAPRDYEAIASTTTRKAQYLTDRDTAGIISSIGIFSADTGANSSPHAVISNNYCEYYAVMLYGGGADYCRVIGNTCYKTYDSALYTRAKGSVFVGNNVFHAGKDGIKNIQSEGEKSVIMGNVINVVGTLIAEGGTAINVIGSDFSITGNQVTLGSQVSGQVASSSNQCVGVSANNVTINGNSFRGVPETNNSAAVNLNIFWNAADLSNINITGNSVYGINVGAVFYNTGSNYIFSKVNYSHNTHESCVGMVSITGRAGYVCKWITVHNNQGEFTGKVMSFAYLDQVYVSGNVARNTVGGVYNLVDVTYTSNMRYFQNNLFNAANAFVSFVVDANSTNVRVDGNMYENVSVNPTANTIPYHRNGTTTTAARPTFMGTADAGYSIWDSTIGKMIFWSGTAWKLADGTAA